MITLKEIAGYLPYGLKVIYTGNGKPFKGTKRIEELTIQNLELMLFLNKRAPLFHPLSDLIKPCLDGGKIPIVEMLKICYKNIYNYYPEIKCTSFFGEDLSFEVIAYDEDRERMLFIWDVHMTSFAFCVNGNAMFINQLQLFDWLYEHHFDLHNLIGENLAIDINSIK